MHARALLGDDEFAAGEIAFRFREQYCDLEREDMLTVEVLVQAVVIAGTVLEQQRGGPCLSGDVATVEKGRVVAWEPTGEIASREISTNVRIGSVNVRRNDSPAH